jgi:hypothetical protein
MIEFIQENKNRPFVGTKRLCGKFDFSLKTGFTPWQIIRFQTDIEGVKRGRRQVANGASIGMSQEDGECHTTEHGGFSAFVRARQESMSGMGRTTQGHGKALLFAFRDMNVVSVAEVEVRRGVRDPLYRVNSGVMEEFDMTFQRPEVLESKTNVHGMKKGMGDGVSRGKKRGKGTRVNGHTIRAKTSIDHLIACSEGHEMLSCFLHRGTHRTEMSICPIRL